VAMLRLRRCRVVLIGLIVVGTSALHGQVVLTPEYERLRPYEGAYEDEGGGTLQIVASPRDNVLVAVLDGARYPLEAVGTDLFINGVGQHVRFSLEPGREGYRLLDGADPGRLFRRVGPDVMTASWRQETEDRKSSSGLRWTWSW
jgi:hypothetical protein